MLRQKGYILDEDKVAYLSGSLGEGGGTSFLEINKVNDIMKRTTKYQGTDK
jgi:pyruvate kinase